MRELKMPLSKSISSSGASAPSTNTSTSSSSSSWSSPSTPAECKSKKKLKTIRQLSKLILSRSASESGDGDNDDSERDHLLEDVEPVHIDPDKMCKSAEQLNGEDVIDYKLRIPSSLVKLNPEEKARLEDVLMRIGLKDCGL